MSLANDQARGERELHDQRAAAAERHAPAGWYKQQRDIHDANWRAGEARRELARLRMAEAMLVADAGTRGGRVDRPIVPPQYPLNIYLVHHADWRAHGKRHSLYWLHHNSGAWYCEVPDGYHDQHSQPGAGSQGIAAADGPPRSRQQPTAVSCACGEPERTRSVPVHDRVETANRAQQLELPV